MRKKLNLSMNVQEVVITMSEGNPGAMYVLCEVAKKDPLLMLDLYDMNIRGPQIWVAFKDHCREDLSAFISKVKARDKKMISVVNAESGVDEVAVARGASFKFRGRDAYI